MIFGTDYYTKAEKVNAKDHYRYRKMVPHKVFCFLPKRLYDGRMVWFQETFRVAIFYSFTDCSAYRYEYFLDEQSALEHSKKCNSMPFYTKAGMAARHYLGTF